MLSNSKSKFEADLSKDVDTVMELRHDIDSLDEELQTVIYDNYHLFLDGVDMSSDICSFLSNLETELEEVESVVDNLITFEKSLL